jgi:hypothetical protein
MHRLIERVIHIALLKVSYMHILAGSSTPE